MRASSLLFSGVFSCSLYCPTSQPRCTRAGAIFFFTSPRLTVSNCKNSVTIVLKLFILDVVVMHPLWAHYIFSYSFLSRSESLRMRTFLSRDTGYAGTYSVTQSIVIIQAKLVNAKVTSAYSPSRPVP
ncbi:hypothetical protein P153DRAFT_116965 [Dothidotthia symphoricarpi CBS 119687]|uniref:Uncharacterized protein n=1 Tax=Dothidotthia symphoricarpi CBS 119687 TaxID=1392245 RepID=A0A6A6A0B3_9PLEO|nr:uncharacterized protein P153DRAFT_116965 [Dothidotthia symphoricarpi CBS 119687]KAF2124956.1 hypothetical protein P153DRAFT_116965 [Dothidotthia symphoricarpi CBS 119687]